MTDYSRAFAAADTAIFIVGADTLLCREMLAMLRSPGTLSAAAATNFELSWRLYQRLYAAAGGAFGGLIHPRLRTRGPVLVMGELTQVAEITAILTATAARISRTRITPLFLDAAFETVARAVCAEMMQTEGCA